MIQNSITHHLFVSALPHQKRQQNKFLQLPVLPSPDSWDDLTSSCIGSDSDNETKHCQARVQNLCLRGKSKFHFLFSKVVLVMMIFSPSWVNCSTSSGCHSSSSYKSSSFCISFHSASGSGILFY